MYVGPGAELEEGRGSPAALSEAAESGRRTSSGHQLSTWKARGGLAAGRPP